ncbi:hypothetical protein DICSQDRAFT_137951 [Dichomitus squalens LYAD-421 SS1]|uniref:Uncharacterized protein n=2 Tax=Dichomitus squalens TaxID=114155 RepID=A0A4Q9MN66_9APHY|nr:uncharacterized protein DICSQDRAFT_137951 [Dichomitus squalens LYAD-421 SS1]EJF60070.1 hypothetical protein DICSQDRAFT_137951 [Dichomitus squalens LYAD-421 SS1]TBU29130.1 hypothetical protein BD311DRAFT_297406 [Dichomitus squalens]
MRIAKRSIRSLTVQCGPCDASTLCYRPSPASTASVAPLLLPFMGRMLVNWQFRSPDARINRPSLNACRQRATMRSPAIPSFQESMARTRIAPGLCF